MGEGIVVSDDGERGPCDVVVEFVHSINNSEEFTIGRSQLTLG